MSQAEASQLLGLAGKYRPYPEYKGAGVEWVGDVPEHWRVGRLGSFGYFIAGCGFPHVDQGRQDEIYPFYKVSDTNHVGNEKYLSKADNYVSKDIASKLGARICSAGGIMFPKVGAALLGNKRRILTQPSITDNNTMVYFSYEGDSSYWYYWLSLLDFGQLSNPGPVPSINESQLKDFVAICPTQGERQQIAAFLDYETARIDRLIAQQKRLIELLKEKRQAVISHAVTKGLNPKAPMKDSGVEWLGQVPEHWQCVPFGLLVSRADLGGNYLGGQEENGIPFLKMGNLGRGCIVLDKLECLEEGSSFDDAHRLSMGDFLFNTRNSLDLVGKVAVWHDELEFTLYNSNLLRVRFKKDFVSSPDFMGFVFNSSGALGWLALLAKGTTSVAAIYYKDLRSMVVPIPPVDEQNAISSFISKCLSRLDTLEKKAIQSINLMNERRTALISAAVTGKIDLRGWTPPAEEAAA